MRIQPGMRIRAMYLATIIARVIMPLPANHSFL